MRCKREKKMLNAVVSFSQVACKMSCSCFPAADKEGVLKHGWVFVYIHIHINSFIGKSRSKDFVSNGRYCLH